MNVFIDTNIFEKKGFFPIVDKHTSLTDLINLSKNNRVTLFTQSHIIYECHNHMQDTHKDLVNRLRKVLKDDLKFKNKDVKDKLKLHRLSSSQLVTDLEKLTKFSSEEFLNDFNKLIEDNFTVIPSSGSIESLQTKFEKLLPPFELKKQNEFSDAMITISTINYFNDNLDNLHVISNDKGFNDSFSDEEIDVYKNIESFIKKNEIFSVEEATNWVKSNTEYIQSEILKTLQDGFHFFLGHSNSDEVEEITEVEIDSSYIYENDARELICTFSLLVKSDVSFISLDGSFYDKEDSIWVRQNLCSGEAQINVELDIQLCRLHEDEFSLEILLIDELTFSEEDLID